jgi:uncharacterized protein involved in exopolysaccharide biosynthesis
MDDANENEEKESGGGFDIRLVKSYLAFAKGAIKARKLTIIALLAVGIVLTGLVVKFIPRTYTCTTVLTTVENAVLDSDRGPRPLAGAKSMVMRHENLELIIKETDLVKKYPWRRPPLLAFKDRMLQGLFGKPDAKTMVAILVGTMEGKIQVDSEDNDLTIIVDWSDRVTAAELAQATLDGFLKIRHRAEISAFQEKMAILDSHASKMREEISGLAEQLDAAAAAAAAEANKAAAKAGASAAPARVAAPLLAARPKTPITDEQLPELRERLASLKQRLTAAEGERSSRIREETAKLDELKLRLTPNHPQVITQDERVAMASQVPSELALMRAEAGDLESQVKQRDAMMKAGVGTSAGAAGGRATAAGGTEQLPNAVAMILSREEGDPALRAQLSGAVVRYGSLRDDVRAAKLSLDTAQAAFNHRYQVVIPVEEPSKPTKPNLLGVAAGGFFLSLLLALLVPIITELRRGVLVEYWQVDAFQLPVLADLRLPPAGKE